MSAGGPLHTCSVCGRVLHQAAMWAAEPWSLSEGEAERWSCRSLRQCAKAYGRYLDSQLAKLAELRAAEVERTMTEREAYLAELGKGCPGPEGELCQALPGEVACQRCPVFADLGQVTA